MKPDEILTKILIIVLAVCCVCMMYLLAKQSTTSDSRNIPEITAIITEFTAESETIDNLNRTDQNTASYIINTNTKKFHRTDCSEIQKIKPENSAPVSDSKETLEILGYTGCKKCNP